jgi:hypothetical protein
LNRYVLDANIVLAAFVGTLASPPALLLVGVHNGDLEAVACPLLVDEVRDNLAKPYFRGLLSELAAREAMEAAGTARAPQSVGVAGCRGLGVSGEQRGAAEPGQRPPPRAQAGA